ncbi:ATP synthase F1 subunit delta [Liquorilactobacillus satsumensis]|nr:ATP synthase F1 subunit delta [Liquorilactobacillus satsumensis]MCC7667314.1 F0F1 ATP synthase subunit delta [Liquorilactobacillus satsumensis]MCP9312385.1 F0F1 ATP synthase subunit delta [Liquorilactobacillus satsumensis]MCP9327640.1 F0F1 ATP synthase subunit delta [Liquorilactobacillus satsumensis]MCP9357088.1 F0F1 ATP synthase subunit delta [Liquorilactobacillus satsumensis]MCP9359611.1 F0F1 ATP synthase subunit delta [Liquorilactobacillus satsumensis]
MKLSKTMVAHRYGNALFALAKEKNVREELLAELLEMKKALAEEPQLMVFLTSKQIEPGVRREVIEKLAASSSELAANLLRMLFDYGRIADLDVIITEYVRLNDSFENTVRATVTTAIPLAEEQKDRLTSAFAKIVGANKIILDERVDPSVIGGAILRSNDYVYDGSLKLKIARIRRMLLK